MDPNYHYLDCSEGSLYLRRDAPIAEMGLGLEDVEEYDQPIECAFRVYDNTKSYMCYEANMDKYIDYVLKLDAEKAKHLYVIGRDFHIVRVPKEMADYTRLRVRSAGCCGSEDETYVEVNRSKAIIDLTKKMLEDLENAKHFKDSHSSSARTDPTPEKLAHLKEKIAFFETVKVEEVKTPFSRHSEYDHEYDDDYENDEHDYNHVHAEYV